MALLQEPLADRARAEASQKGDDFMVHNRQASLVKTYAANGCNGSLLFVNV